MGEDIHALTQTRTHRHRNRHKRRCSRLHTQILRTHTHTLSHLHTHPCTTHVHSRDSKNIFESQVDNPYWFGLNLRVDNLIHQNEKPGTKTRHLWCHTCAGWNALFEHQNQILNRIIALHPRLLLPLQGVLCCSIKFTPHPHTSMPWSVSYAANQALRWGRLAAQGYCVRECACIHIHIYVVTHMCICICVYICRYMNICIYTYTYLYIHIETKKDMYIHRNIYI